MSDHVHRYIIENANISGFGYTDILKHSSGLHETHPRGLGGIQVRSIELNSGIFTAISARFTPHEVSIIQDDHHITLLCNCHFSGKSLCEHQSYILSSVIDNQQLRMFFDRKLRHEKIKKEASDYGIENESSPDDYFMLQYEQQSTKIIPKMKELFPVNAQSKAAIKADLMPVSLLHLPQKTKGSNKVKTILVIGKHKYYDQLEITLFEVQTGKDNQIKNPFTPLNPLDLVWKTETIEEAKFYSAVSKFQNNFNSQAESDMEGLKILVKNPLRLNTFYHDSSLSEKINAGSIVEINLDILPIDISISVDMKKPFYEVTGHLVLNDILLPLKKTQIKYNYFILVEHTFYLAGQVHLLRMIEFFRKNNDKILVHQSKYEEFQSQILAPLEHHTHIRYAYLKPATEEQVIEQGFNQTPEKFIYLANHESFVSITPVVKYGNMEIPIFSRKQIQDTDQNGNVFTVERDEELEIQFTSSLMRQHPEFEQQLNTGESFYLHQQEFLDEHWFLDSFEEWRKQGIQILGFNELKGNKLNSNKAKITIQVNSGIDWFNAAIGVHFGRQKAGLKQLHKSIRNKSKYVTLDDGSTGILPAEWMEKISAYFQAGDILDESILIPKQNYSDIDALFEQDAFSEEVKQELEFYKSRFANFESIKNIDVPEGLHATLRDYQKQGLNWLNFLDDYNFGACLADDMGLGKTIQIIAFILSQRQKQTHNTNLVIVPTSLLFNWQAEIAKFAPSIRLYTSYGENKVKDISTFDQYEVILTTYGMLLSDINWLKNYRFNYIFLDESQAIKNPESQRYKAARLLQSRNKVVLTGTPIENNTFDIFGQLSFACPGLLGNKQQFKDLYAIPSDKFRDSRSAKELQKKVNPFILRRTKKQVATELPEKTEMIIYCEMGVEQKRVYDACEKELREFIASTKEEEVSQKSMYVLKGLTRLRQVCDSPVLLNSGEYPGTQSAKIDVLMEQIENKSGNHKILVFSQFVSMLDLIKKELETKEIPFEYLTGQTRNRAEKVNSFQNNKDIRVFLISLKAGGTGLNLTEADYVYLVDPWWNPAVENQAIDRSYRIGQKKNVIAVRLICPGTVEEKIINLQASKTELANDLIKTDTSILKTINKKELLDILG